MRDCLVGQVPDNWTLSTLGEVCRRGGGDIQTGPFGSQLHASDYVLEGIPSVMPQNIGDNTLLEEGIARITSADAKRLSRYLLEPGDIIYSRRGDVERRALVKTEHAGWLCGTGCLRVRLRHGADNCYMSYYLGHPDVRAWIVRHSVGATMRNLNTQILSSVPVVLPPMRTQKAIGRMLQALDDRIAVNKRIADTALKLGSTYYAHHASRWHMARQVTLGEAARWYSGGTPKTDEPSYWNGDVPWISAANLRSPWIDDSTRRLTSAGVRNGTRLVPRESILLVRQPPIAS